MGMMILIAITVLCCLIYYSKIKVTICYQRESNNDHGEVKISGLGGLIHYHIAIPTVDFKNMDAGIKVESENKDKGGKDTFITKEKIEFLYEGYEDLLHQVTFFQESVRWFMARVRCEKWEWKTVVGTGDAAEAGVLTGLVWGVKTNILGFISHYIQWSNPPELAVTPSFQKSVLDTTFESDFSFRFGSGIRFLIILWYRMKGR